MPTMQYFVIAQFVGPLLFVDSSIVWECFYALSV